MAESETPADAVRLLALLEALAGEVHRRPLTARPGLTTDLDRDLGLDSLARVELLARMEKQFGVGIPEAGFLEARTPAQLLALLERARTEGQAPRRTREAIPPGLAATPVATVTLPTEAETLIAVLEHHAAHSPDRVHIRFYEDEGDGATLTHAELLAGARGVAAGLRDLDVAPGDTVALMLETGTDYFHCFFGILLAGAVPVPLYPPASAAQFEDHVRRQTEVLRNCGARLLIAMPAAGRVGGLLRVRVDSLQRVITPDLLPRSADAPPRLTIRGDDLAFLQYTSGSTGTPKGVMLSHANLLANIRAMADWIDAGPDDVFVSWLPLYHDMGLIGAWLGSLYCGAELVIMSPLAFIARPQRWLHAIHRHRGTLSASPNFGYALCVDRLDDADVEGLDLGSWRCAFNGAEPVSPTTLRRFAERFSRHGLRPGALMPVYGLAECSVGLAFPPPDRGPRFDRIAREEFLRTGHARPTDAEDALEFSSCGQALPGHEIRVSDDGGAELPERQLGRLQFRGPSATRGYFGNEEASASLRRGEWLDSGDLAYVAQGEIHVTGRIKDLIIRAGRNIHPQDLEEAVGRLDGIRAGRVAAFASRGEGAEERLVVVAETHERDADKRAKLRDRVAGEVAVLAGPPDEILLTAPGVILKTPSGKVRRGAMRELYERGALRHAPLPLWRQLSRLSLDSLGARLRQLLRAGFGRLYAVWAHLLFWGIGAPLAAIAVLVLPGRRLRWKTLRLLIGTLAAATGVRLRVENADLLPQPGSGAVLACNHASYLDAPLLILALPEPVAFVAKAELDRQPLLRGFLRRLGVRFVERSDARQGAADARRLSAALAAGETLLYFPEGTFTRAPGLRNFRMGAFIAAAENRAPLIPVALRGTRSLLRSGSWRPRPGTVTVTVTPALTLTETGERRREVWNAAVDLRERARAAILTHCGEPDLKPGSDPIDQRRRLKTDCPENGV